MKKYLLAIALTLGATTSWAIYPADSDSDGIIDDLDNCVNVPNPTQWDGDGDGIGSLCDGDLNNVGAVVNFGDLEYMGSVFFSTDPIGDLDNSGFVNFDDLAILEDLFFTVPGPSGFCALNPSACDGPNPAVFEFINQPVTGDKFNIRLSDPNLIAHARALLGGGTTDLPHIIGDLACTSVSYNAAWDSHMIEGTISFFDNTIELCDGTVAYANENCEIWQTEEWCPWASELTREIGN